MKNKLFLSTAFVFATLIFGLWAADAYATEPEPPGFEYSGHIAYKTKECLFKPDVKCTGVGTECALADPCGN